MLKDKVFKYISYFYLIILFLHTLLYSVFIILHLIIFTFDFKPNIKNETINEFVGLILIGIGGSNAKYYLLFMSLTFVISLIIIAKDKK